ncbi:MAG: Crp/Fnr family transcriptional regulator [Fibrobacter sp.]|nr:Crp/Fnr family transcriptional regulator [Fibrobacter sp.]
MYTPTSEERSIVILNDGELQARNKDYPNQVIFSMHPGDLVGVAALLEGEPFHHELVASKDSDITIVNEECMESELKRLPLWLLATIRSLSHKTRRFKYASKQTSVKNSLKSLATYCRQKKSEKDMNLTGMVREFCWLTKITPSVALEDFKSMVRRRLLFVTKIGNTTICRIPSNEIISIFIDYLEASEIGKPFTPYKLSQEQKKFLCHLSELPPSTKNSQLGWLEKIREFNPKADVAEWLNLVHLGWFLQATEESFTINTDKIKYFITALRYEMNIRGLL